MVRFRIILPVLSTKVADHFENDGSNPFIYFDNLNQTLPPKHVQEQVV
jgi:hypothetical protein